MLAALLVAAASTKGAGAHVSDSPESKLRARIADLRADVEVMKIECAAARHNLLECMKRSGKLELEDHKTAVSQIRAEIGQLQTVAQTLPSERIGELGSKFDRVAQNGVFKGEKIDARLFREFLKGGDAGEKALDRMAEIEYQARLDSARAESDRARPIFSRRSDR